VSEYDRDRRWARELLIDVDKADVAPIVVDDRNVNDRYKDPGRFVTEVTARGTRVVREVGGAVFRTGQGATSDGELPFLDRFELATQKTERLWQCAKGSYESAVAFLDARPGAKPTIVTSYETPTETPNFRVRDLERGSVSALTSFPDPQPLLRGVKKELVKYERKDGVDLSATLYLPPSWKEGPRLPLFVWAYPLEYTDASTASQVSGSPSRFARVRGASQLLFALHGWAVLDNAAMPVVGDPETMNDTFLDQVVASAQAAIDYAVERGIADRERVAVGGHSYGAFMTANLLAHCDLFKAGVARSGAYNRTLTPFGFQSERRTVWEAPSSYVKLSPFMAADKIDEPLLLIHGEKDNNQGTFPMQSERLFQAVKGNGGTTRLVILPGESHGYAARESNLHVVAEMFEWCDRFCSGAKAPSASTAPASASSPASPASKRQ
jgi:dipeptidyl aminopeptidase/acylaminoacyl peptidase